MREKTSIRKEEKQLGNYVRWTGNEKIWTVLKIYMNQSSQIVSKVSFYFAELCQLTPKQLEITRADLKKECMAKVKKSTEKKM